MGNWKTVVVAGETPLTEAIKRIDASALQVALVVSAEGALEGIVTDGDIRRALLKGASLDIPVREAMNRRPSTALATTPRDEQLAIMRRKAIRHLPLVDVAGLLTGLATMDELTGLTRRDNWVVLMAGGLGSRLRPLTDNCPKPMLQVGNKPLLQTILEKFIESGFHRFYISVNYMADVIEEYFGDGSRWRVEIVYLHEEKRMGTAGALGLLPGKPDLPLLVMNGDVLTKVNFRQLLDFHVEHTSVATMCVREYDFQVPYGVVTADGHRIVSIDEKPIQTFFVNAGIYVIEPAALDAIPPGQFFDMPTLFTEMIQGGRGTSVFPIREYWLDIGHMADYQRANGEYMDVFS